MAKKIKNRTEKYKKSNEIIRSILEVAPFGIYIIGSKGSFDYVNSAMIAISGDTYEQFKSLNAFKIPSYKRIGLDKKIRAIFGGGSFSLKSVKYTSYYSKKTTIRNMIGIPLEEKGEKKALIFVEDITQIKKAEEEMVKAMNIKSQFISLASHELRSPLGIIGMYITSLATGESENLTEKQKEYLNVAKRNIDRLIRLVTDVLNYQKLEAGKMGFKMEKGDINELVEEISKEVRPLMESKKLCIKLSLSKEMPKIMFDKDKITQVLINLINNALKFTDKGGLIIKSVKLKNGIRISVIDTGMGIKKEDLHKLFRSFSQINTDRGERPKGTGLGLAISKMIIEKHGGSFEVKSEWGSGSVFSFILPIK
ncbi:MAG: hypothetical protein COS99_03125 [Candidatus Omnitrophica bacterium CG07_land_8_20_14_0_80_42_15]|uniref:histidine kinase n=1 Tax=Candidatus Aquitaenariimonas noxiae TaxID=1974741 RepID=A0A2J0KX23_9BACT|nr:MAG: hypothetical protein COS99_03125 [Candidatus Omnitrophica bacterium CG07_land_8_20_14_0_80_42_15]